MNSDLAYFDVFLNIEILHLNDSNEFENKINKQLEKKIEPMERTLETQDFKELLTEFQEVFAWSYKDMLGIDP